MEFNAWRLLKKKVSGTCRTLTPNKYNKRTREKKNRDAKV